LLAYLSKNSEVIKYTTWHVVIADWLFTTPSVLIQPITGIGLMSILHYPFYSPWFLSVIALYILIGCCWIPVVFIQYQLRNSVAKLQAGEALPISYHARMKCWIALGIPAFLAILVIYWLMISKVGIYSLKVS